VSHGRPKEDVVIGIRPFEPEDAVLVASWLAAEENHKWLDFGQGVQAPTAVSLRLMAQRDLHRLYLYTAEDGRTPIGIVALSNIDRGFGTASCWYVLGDKSQGGGGRTTAAVRRVLSVAFDELGLRAVNAWAVEANRPSVRVLEKAGFRPAGRLRRCHVVDGAPCDRLLFDVLSEEAPRA
jgi:RimJ/RimL family protein N-acetyltransferase